MATSDISLHERWLSQRDGDAFAEIVARHSGMVYGTCKRILRNATEAEDVAQECFIDLAQSSKVIKPSLAGWLYTAAFRRSLNRIKAEERRKRREAQFAREAASNVEMTWDDVWAHVDEAIVNLPKKLREPIIFRFLEGQTHEFIARNLAISSSGVKHRLAKGIEEIRKFLKNRGVTVGAISLAAMMETNLAEAAPPGLIEVLGKLALAGITSATVPATTVGGTTSLAKGLVTGGFFVMTKKILLGLGVVLLLLLMAIPFLNRSQKARREVETISASQQEQEISVAPVEEASTPPLLVEPADEETMPIPEGGSIEGMLVDSSGRPIGGWNVSATRVIAPGKFRSAYRGPTGEDGRFLISGLDEGEYRLYAFPPFEEGTHFSVRGQQTVVRLGKNEEKKGVRLVFDEGLTISGWVVDTEGNPIPNASVYAEPIMEVLIDLEPDVMSENATQHADSTGNFRLISLLDADYNVRVSADGYAQVNLDPIPAGTEGLDIVLEDVRVFVNGQVVTGFFNRAVQEFEIGYVRGIVDEWEPWIDTIKYTPVSDRRGRFELAATHLDGALTLIARADGFFPGIEPLMGIDSNRLDDVTLRLEKGGIDISGKVIDSSGFPVAGAHVFVGPPPNPIRLEYERRARTSTSEDGTFTVSIRPEDRQISAALKGYIPGVASIPPDISRRGTEIEIVLPAEGGQIEGLITVNGEPLPKAEIQLFAGNQWQGAASFYYGKTNQNGEFHIEDLPLSTMTVAVVFDIESDGGQTEVWLERQVDLESGKPIDLSFDYYPGNASMEGQVTVEGEIQGTKPNVRVRVVYGGEYDTTEVYRAMAHMVDNEGFYRLIGLPGGNAELVVNFPWSGVPPEWSQQITIQEGEAKTLNVDIEN